MAGTLKYAFRISHIDNIPHIIQYGLVRADSPNRNPDYVSIGDTQVIHLRGERMVKGYRLNNFVPFYLGPRSPMLYVIQHGYNGVKRVEPEKIVYCVVLLDDLIKSEIDCIFTDGHALSALTSYFPKEKLPQIDSFVRYDDVYSTQWNIEEDIDLKRRKEAELLLNCDLAPQYIRGYVVYNNEAKEQLVGMGIAAETIVVARNYYF